VLDEIKRDFRIQ
jgi:hypothetical protein